MGIIETYNPANANISEQELAAMRNLSNEEIAQLATAYPNQPRGNTYLVYYNTSETLTQQRYPLGTWSNLHNLRQLGKSEFVPYSFSKNHFIKPVAPVKPAPSRVVDLSKDDISNAEGLKKVEGFTSLKVGEGGIADIINVDTSDLSRPDDKQLQDTTVADLEQKLAQAKAEHAHPQIIKKIEKELKAAKK